ncbi:MAG: DUF1559 domain-containing protein [Planctomycetaceae bacterium]|nr:DUF1559 domain-containing protein [Planctomycetaceae bacterium]
MRRITASCRRGFTFVELLIVAAIIAILIALLLPAVQQSREAARRMTCKNNLRQLGVALQNYYDQFEMFPAGTTNSEGPIQNEPAGYHHNWVIALLPHLDQRPLAGRIDPTLGIYDPKHREVRRTRIPSLLCPTDPARDRASATGEALEPLLTNYAGCHHPIEAPIDVHNRGVLFLNSFVRIPQIEDGTSKTLMVGEFKRAMDDLGWASGTRATLRNTWLPPNTTPGGGAYYTDPYFRETALLPQGWKAQWTSAGLVPPSPPKTTTRSDNESAEASSDGGIDDSREDFMFDDQFGNPLGSSGLPDDLLQKLTENPLLIVGGFGSYHTGGAQVLLVDTSVRFLSENIDADLFHLLGDRADRQLNDEF